MILAIYCQQRYVSVLHQGQGVFGGGDTDPAYIDAIQFVTIASTGNTQDFGDLTDAGHYATEFQMELVEYLLVENNQHQEILLTMLPLHKQEMQLTLVIYLQQDTKDLLILQQGCILGGSKHR